MRKLMLFMILVLFAFIIRGERMAVLPDLNEPFLLKADDTWLYIVDGAGIFIYSCEDFRILDTYYH